MSEYLIISLVQILVQDKTNLKENLKPDAIPRPCKLGTKTIWLKAGIPFSVCVGGEGGGRGEAGD